MAVRGVNFALPGAYGLNTQSEIADSEELRYVTLARNGVIDQSGKLVSRKEFLIQTAAHGAAVEQMYTHRKNDGTEDIYSAAGGKVYTGTSGGTLTMRYDNSGTSTTANNWQFASLSSKVFGFQRQQTPFVLNESTYASESFTGAPWTKPNVIMAAVGRLWAADDEAGGSRHTVWWSNLLDGKVWNGAGDAGNLNVQRAWPNGQDSIIALEFLSGRLIIFGRNSILMYTLPADNDPADMTLTDVIENIGCIARDSVVIAGGSIFFLAHDGYYKIAPLAQVTSLLAPLKVTKLVSDDFISSLAGADLAKVRAGYNPVEKFVVLAIPDSNKTWCFHVDRNIPQIELPPVTDWTNSSNPFRAFCYDKDGTWYAGTTDGLAIYTGYLPSGASSAYNFEWYTQWNAFGDETRLKHAKDFAMTMEADVGQTGTFRWQMDYKEGSTRSATFTCSSADFAEAPGIGVVKGAIGGSFNTARFGAITAITGDKVSLHALRVYAKPGIVKVR